MQKKIVYFVQNYRPEYEAISKEVEILSKNFNSEIFNMNFRNPLTYYKLLRLPFLKRDINHIYTSLGDRPYLSLLRKKPIVLTGSSEAKIDKIRERMKFYGKIDKLVVESERQRGILLDIGVDESKIRLIPPGVDLKEFSYKKEERFTILFASSPTRVEQMKSRGIDLMLEIAKKNRSINFIFLWRKTGYSNLIKKINERNLKNVEIINEIVTNINEIYARSSCTIAPFLDFESHKPIPRSIIESLAAGKPVLVSNKVSIANIVDNERCGVVFEPSIDSVVDAISKLKENYSRYQENSRRTSEKYFSKERFVEDYRKLYDEIL